MDKHCLKCDLCYNLGCPDYVAHDDPAIISFDSYKILEDEVIELNNQLAQAEKKIEAYRLLCAAYRMEEQKQYSRALAMLEALGGEE